MEEETLWCHWLCGLQQAGTNVTAEYFLLPRARNISSEYFLTEYFLLPRARNISSEYFLPEYFFADCFLLEYFFAD